MSKPEEKRKRRMLLAAISRARARIEVRQILTRQFLWTLLVIPLIMGGAQIWHRLADAESSPTVREVRMLNGASGIPDVSTAEFIDAMQALTETSMSNGHHLELLLDGPTALARMETDIRSARRSIIVQSYSCGAGRVMTWLEKLLTSKAREGVRVLFLGDGFGCRGLDQGFTDSLRASGALVTTVRPLRWYSLHRSSHRSHMRSVVIDGVVGYTGGFGFDDKWISSEDGPPWHETTVRFTGPSVLQLVGAVAINWSGATGTLLTGEGMYPTSNSRTETRAALERPRKITTTLPVDSLAIRPIVTRDILAGLMYTTHTYGTPVPERFLALSIAGARHHIYIANPYFIPNADLRRWLKDAVARGVDVRIMTAGSNIDVKVIRWASRSTYEDLLEGGVRIAEYTPSMLHKKTMVVDGVFGSVGSLNLDNISLRINDEAVLMAQDSAFGAALDSSFVADLQHSREIDLEQFQHRPLYDRVMTGMMRMFRDFM